MVLIKTYQKYLIKKFINNFLIIFFIFFTLGFIMNFLRELRFFFDIDVSLYYPLLLVFLDLPSQLFQVIPFIIIISVILLFIQLNDKGEIVIFKNNGLSNLKILNNIALTSFFVGLFSVIIFYNFAAVLKFNYLNIKLEYTKDDKFLASITENGIWIKDVNDEKINFINAKKIELNHLIEAEITLLDNEFNYLGTIIANKINIEKNQWILKKPQLISIDNEISEYEEMKFYSNFNYKKINNLYSDLSSLTLWGLLKLKNDYNEVNYSTTEVDYHFQKVIAYPVYLTVMAILITTIIFNIKIDNRKIQLIVLGIFISVLIYYINDFFGIIGKNEKIPIYISIWGPQLILIIISTIGLLKLNEK